MTAKALRFEVERWETVKAFLIERAEATEGDFYGCKCGVDCRLQPILSDVLDRPSDEFTYAAAKEHCLAKGMRLPSAVEWEAAAGGPAHFDYSWGPKMDDSRKLERKSVLIPGTDVAKSVYAKPVAETSAFGTLGMSGGAPEYVDGDAGIAKGASRLSEFGNARFQVFFGEVVPFAGVRCVKDLKGSKGSE